MSSIINRALLIEQIKRFWAIPAFSTVAYMLLVYMPMRGNDDWWTMRQLIDIVTMGPNFHLFIVVLTPVLAAFCTFGMFFNKKTATAFYSMPLSKNQLFATNVLAGIVLSLIPVLVFCLLLLLPISVHTGPAQDFHLTTWSWNPQNTMPISVLPGGVTPGAPVNTFPVIFSLFMQMSLVTVFYFAVAWLAFSLAGHGFVALCLVVVLPFVPMGLMMSAEGIGNLFVFGFNGLFQSSQFSNFLAYHNPAAWGILIRPGVLSRVEAIYIPALIYIVIATALFACAWLVSHKRKPERTGNSVIFNPVRHVLVFLFSFASMLIMAIIFLGTSNNIANMYIGAVIGFVVGYVAAQMIAEKSFLVLGKMKCLPIFGGVAVGVYLAVILVTQFGLSFFVNRLPSRDEVYAVYVTGHHLFGGNVTDGEWRSISFTDPDVIEATLAAHQKILDGRGELHQIPDRIGYRARTYAISQHDGTIRTRENLFFRYILNDGTVVSRQYSITGDFIQNAGLTEFLMSEAVVLAPFIALRDPSAISQIEIRFHHRGDFGNWSDIVHATTITNAAEINIAMELISQVAMENVDETRRDMFVRSFETPVVTTSIWFNQTSRMRYDGGWSNLPWWSAPRIDGDAAIRLHELLIEHGLGEQEGLDELF
ncbi:MAG: hypothetical protein FWF78_10205 [Defluviitaleaceae bacterium]|nr:hypothetical protein [Defluviitaleaceae bacterium]